MGGESSPLKALPSRRHRSCSRPCHDRPLQRFQAPRTGTRLVSFVCTRRPRGWAGWQRLGFRAAALPVLKGFRITFERWSGWDAQQYLCLALDPWLLGSYWKRAFTHFHATRNAPRRPFRGLRGRSRRDVSVSIRNLHVRGHATESENRLHRKWTDCA